MGVEGLRFVITGAAAGIGAATARLAASRGASVMLSDLDDTKGEAVAAEIRATGGAAAFTHCDVTDEAQVAALMRATAETFGGIDVLHNNAGIHETAVSGDVDLESMSLATFRKVLEVNAVGPWLCAKHALPWLKESANASIVNAASTGSWVGYPNNVAYGTSKGGIHLQTKNLAVDLARYGIRVNCYSPTAIATEMTTQFVESQPDPAAFEKALVSTSLIPRLGKPVEVAELVCFLAGPESAFVNGACIVIDGGSLAWRGTVDQLGLG
ncbi:MAG: SDR family oxidoreductase [Actinobacteria bacterium]|nr:SDR family oxidoreductase [Actinomycetota bacterium]